MIMKVTRIGMSLFQVTFLRSLKAMTEDVVRARRPERAVASAYDGIMNGSNVIMNMPNPNPVVL